MSTETSAYLRLPLRDREEVAWAFCVRIEGRWYGDAIRNEWLRYREQFANDVFTDLAASASADQKPSPGEPTAGRRVGGGNEL